MITYVYINGFKSFHKFEMEFTPFTVVAGANASGKSNLFDALMLLARLVESSNIKKVFTQQRGEFIELFTKYNNNESAKVMHFKVEILVNRTVKDAWGNEATLKYTRLRYELKIERYTNNIGMEDLAVTYEQLEKLNHNADKWIKIIPPKYLNIWRPKVKTGKRGIPYIKTDKENGLPIILVPQDGKTGNKRRFPLNKATRTVLSTFDTIDFPHVLAAKEEIKSWKLLQFNPTDLRQPTDKRRGEDVISSSGKNLAAALYRIKQEDKYSLIEISRRLNEFLPNFVKLDVIDDKKNKQYLIKLKDTNHKIYSSRVLSEGTLRFLALCILEYDDTQTGLLCFEEPENGIHPFRIKDMAKLLKDLTTDFSDEEMPLRQMIINTHSPNLLGFLRTWQADKSVSIWFSRLQSKITTINGKRQEIHVTKITPIVKIRQMNIKHSEEEFKWNLTKVQQYLNTNYSN